MNDLRDETTLTVERPERRALWAASVGALMTALQEAGVEPDAVESLAEEAALNLARRKWGLIREEEAAFALAALDREREVRNVERLMLAVAYEPFDKEPSSEWGRWETLLDRLMSIHGGPSDSSVREAAAMFRELQRRLTLTENEAPS